jgi:hypothetical protein
MANENFNHQRSKHIDIRHHFIQEAIKDGDMKLTWVSICRNGSRYHDKNSTSTSIHSTSRPLECHPLSDFLDRSKKAVGNDAPIKESKETQEVLSASQLRSLKQGSLLWPLTPPISVHLPQILPGMMLP